MLEKNIEKQKRKEQRRPIGRPVRFPKKTDYNRRKQKEKDRRESW